MLSRALILLALTAVALPPEDPSLGPSAAGQAVADALREFTGSDVAIVPAGALKAGERSDEAASALAFGTDGVVVLSLSGAKLREALERSIAAFPQSSASFLQVSGLEASFKRSAPANARLTSVTVAGARLEDGRSYTVAMPLSLQQGQLGYANLWENIKPRPFKEATLASVVKGRRVAPGFVARWSPSA